MSGSIGKKKNGTEENNSKSLFIFIDVGLAALDKLQVAIDDTTTANDLKYKIELLSGIPSDLFELEHDGVTLDVESASPLLVTVGKVSIGVVLKMRILPVWERFIYTCLKQENSQVRARIRVKMHGVTKEERIFVACFVAARQANSALLFGLLPCNKMITRTVRLSKRNILHAAVIGANRNCIANVLMNGGGKLINMGDVYGETPMSMAETLNTGDIVDMLEAYKMVSLNGEGSKKVKNDEDYGYECIISQHMNKQKEPIQQDSEVDYELSSGEDDETQGFLSKQDLKLKRELNEMSSSIVTGTRHFLDRLTDYDKTTATTKANDVTERVASEQCLLKELSGNCRQDNEKNGSKEGHADQTTGNKESINNGVDKKTVVDVIFRPKRVEEIGHVLTKSNMCTINENLLEVSYRDKADSSKTNSHVMGTEVVGPTLETPSDSDGMNYDSETSLKEPKNMSSSFSTLTENGSAKINLKICENRMKDIAMVTDKDSNNRCIDSVNNYIENPIKKGSHTLKGEMISDGETQEQTTAVGDKQPPDINDTGNPLDGDQIQNNKPDGNLLLRRRKKGMPSLIVSRTSGLSSSFETLYLLDPTGKAVDSVAMESQADFCLNVSDENQVCSPPIIKGALIPKPPSSPVPIDKNRQQMRRRKFSTGSSTSGSPKSYSRNDMELYLDEAWRRASDSDVKESLPSPPTRPRSYSTPHPPDSRQLIIHKPTTSSDTANKTYDTREISSESKRFNSSNVLTFNNPTRRQSVGGWARKHSLAMTFDEWLEAKEQQRRNSLVVQKEMERRLSLGNQPPTSRFSKNINYEQWLEMKASEPERKASQDTTLSCHGNERSRAESTKAFKTWLQKKDEEAMEREQRLLDEAISRKTRDTKREDLLTQLIQKMENKKRSGGESKS